MGTLGSATSDAALAADDDFVRVLRDVVDALDAAEIPFGIIGGVASAAYGRPRWTKDIDVFCRVEDAEPVLDVLESHGFDVERTNPTWIYKAFRNDVVVDVIFKAKAEVYFDEAMRARVERRSLWGVEVPLVPAEDIVITKAIATDESSPNHWWDALCILAGNDLDWDYLLERARKGPNRVASLLHFALSTDVAVPAAVVRQLDEMIATTWDTAWSGTPTA
jgi:predicted nucleotidyltransferase